MVIYLVLFLIYVPVLLIYVSVLYAFLTRKCSTIQHGNSLFFSQNSFPAMLLYDVTIMLPLQALAFFMS